jgi:hypothetical protein
MRLSPTKQRPMYFANGRLPVSWHIKVVGVIDTSAGCNGIATAANTHGCMPRPLPMAAHAAAADVVPACPPPLLPAHSSFILAFYSVKDATTFAMDVQLELLNARWPQEVSRPLGWQGYTKLRSDMQRSRRKRCTAGNSCGTQAIHLINCDSFTASTSSFCHESPEARSSCLVPHVTAPGTRGVRACGGTCAGRTPVHQVSRTILSSCPGQVP